MHDITKLAHDLFLQLVERDAMPEAFQHLNELLKALSAGPEPRPVGKREFGEVPSNGWIDPSPEELKDWESVTDGTAMSMVPHMTWKQFSIKHNLHYQEEILKNGLSKIQIVDSHENVAYIIEV